MKRSLFALINYILIFLFLAANPAWAATNATPLNTQVVVSATQLNVRSAPTVDAGKISTLSKNTVVDALAVKDGWFQIQVAQGQAGWVHGDYVYTKDTNPAKKLISTQYVAVTASVANLRSAAATDAPVVATLKSGNTAALVKTEGSWQYIRLADGKTGYVPSNHVKIAKMALSSADKPAPLSGFKKLVSRQDPPSRSDDRDEPTPPTMPTTPPANSGQVVLSLNGTTSNAANKIEKIEVVKNDKQLVVRVVTDNPISFNDKLDDNQIIVNISDALGIEEGNYSLNLGNVEYLDVYTSGSNTILNIGATSDTTYTSQRVSGKPEFVVIIPLTKETPPANNNGGLAGRLIVIDAGHGGMHAGFSDPGAIGPSKLKERDVVLEIARKTKSLLEDQGATVLMTREGDETQLSLDGRAKVANDNGADIFVSIHANASTSPTLAGTSTYFYAPVGTTQGQQRASRQKLAQSVQDALVAKLKRRNIGILEANFAVLRSTTVPSILVETAFISNPEEEKLLADDIFRQQAAEGIANGIAKYFSN